MRLVCASIAAANYSHVGYFPSLEDYDDFYEILTGVVDFGIASFKEYVIKAFVEYLRTHLNDEGAAADWFEQNWTGPRGRYCLCDAGYAGSNNNMGIEVDWRDIKLQCPATSSLGTFLGALWEFIKQLAREHQTLLEDLGDADNFPESLSPSKELFDRLQDRHPKTLILTTLLSGRAKLVQEYFDYIEYVHAQGRHNTPLHLKIRLSHEMRLRDKSLAESLKIENFYTALMPTQQLLKKLDPDGTRTVEQVEADLTPLRAQYQSLVIDNRPDLVVPPEPDVKAAMNIYKNFHLLKRSLAWGDIPVQCTCPDCFKDCVCVHGVLFASFFRDSEYLRVPDEYIAATVGLRKKCKMIKGTAGVKRKRLMKEYAATKKKAESKIKFMKVPAGAKVTPDGSGSKSKTFVVPDASVPSSSEDEDLEPEVLAHGLVYESCAYCFPCAGRPCFGRQVAEVEPDIYSPGGWTASFAAGDPRVTAPCITGIAEGNHKFLHFSLHR